MWHNTQDYHVQIVFVMAQLVMILPTYGGSTTKRVSKQLNNIVIVEGKSVICRRSIIDYNVCPE